MTTIISNITPFSTSSNAISEIKRNNKIFYRSGFTAEQVKGIALPKRKLSNVDRSKLAKTLALRNKENAKQKARMEKEALRPGRELSPWEKDRLAQKIVRREKLVAKRRLADRKDSAAIVGGEAARAE